MTLSPEPAYQHGTLSKIGVLLINLGTPDAPTAKALRPYLKQFLSDPRVIEIPRWIWWFILNGIILNTRPRKSAEKYAQIWMPEGSPLKVHTEHQTKLLARTLEERIKPAPVVEYAMNIGNPSIADILHRMKDRGCDRILAFPLFPQYAASSTGSAMDSLFSELKKMRNIPAIRTVKHFHDHPGYIAALTQNIQDYWTVNGKPDKLIISFKQDVFRQIGHYPRAFFKLLFQLPRSPAGVTHKQPHAGRVIVIIHNRFLQGIIRSSPIYPRHNLIAPISYWRTMQHVQRIELHGATLVDI